MEKIPESRLLALYKMSKKGDLPEGRPPCGGNQQPQPPQQRNSRTMRTIQIQLLLSNTLHRQLFIGTSVWKEFGGRRSAASFVCRLSFVVSPVSIIRICRSAPNVRGSPKFFCHGTARSPSNGSEKNFPIPLDKPMEMVYNV